MGCQQSRRVFVINPIVSGQDQSTLEIAESLGLKPNEVNFLYSIFSDIDSHKSGCIRPVELLTYFHLDGHDFEKKLFVLFEENRKGQLDFLEVLVSLWNFLTLPEKYLPFMLYWMKDPSVTEVKDGLEMLHRRKLETVPVLMQHYQRLKDEYPLELSLQDFATWSQGVLPSSTSSNAGATASVLFTPLVIFQLKLRKAIVGEKFWSARMEEREKLASNAAGGGGSVVIWNSFVQQLRQMVKESHSKQKTHMMTIKEAQEGGDRERQLRQTDLLRKAFQVENASPAAASGSSKKGQSSPITRESYGNIAAGDMVQAFDGSSSPSPSAPSSAANSPLNKRKKKITVGIPSVSGSFSADPSYVREIDGEGSSRANQSQNRQRRRKSSSAQSISLESVGSTSSMKVSDVEDSSPPSRRPSLKAQRPESVNRRRRSSSAGSIDEMNVLEPDGGKEHNHPDAVISIS
eukprot:gene6538-7211_t